MTQQPDQRQAIAWAVVDNGQIKVCTVSDTRRGTMVNWLVSERSVMVFSRMTDEAIERMWWQEHGTAQIEYVTITRRDDEQAP